MMAETATEWDIARLSLLGGTGINMRGRYALVLPAGPGAARLGYGDMSGQGVSVIIAVPTSRPWLWGRGRQAGTLLASTAGSVRPEW